MKTTILPHELASALDEAPGGLAMLSLDCFDTLIWRNVHAPKDVFSDFGEGGATRQQRIWAESHARTRAELREGRGETTIAEIYEALLPDGDAETRARSIARELEAEARHCYAFAPTVALMRAAKAAKIQVAIVSDTYLDRDQLLALIAEAAGNELIGLIDHVFCSSEYGVAKSDGLFRHVLRKTGITAARILHIGDNKAADFTAPQALGIPALHFVQFGSVAEQRFRLEAAVGTIVNAHGVRQTPPFQPHRSLLALAEPDLADPAAALGLTTLGPVLHAFAQWVADEARTLNETDGQTHLLFLMRDGHLPQRVFEALETGLPTHPIEISRYTSTAASFVDEAAVLDFLEAELQIETANHTVLAKQLLLEPEETAQLLGKLPAKGRSAAFVKAIRAPAVMREILGRSRDFAKRLVAHVTRVAAPAPGDTLVLVDLGYNGTVQDKVAGLLRDALQVTVAGRYLLLREQTACSGNKQGLFDGRNYSFDTLEALCANVAVIEQLCTAAQGSVVDYDREGRPVRAGTSIKARQSSVRERVQQGCIHFAVQRNVAFIRRPASDNADARRQAAAAALARLMFLPLPPELEVLASFEHDVNLGTDGTVRLFDSRVGARALRQHGLFYIKGSQRMYLPAELRGQGLSASLALLTQRRFGLDLRHADFCDRGIDLPLIVADGNEVALSSVTAHPTHDGYFAAAIPIGECRFAIGVQFGRLYEWVQVDSVQFAPVKGYLADKTVQSGPAVEALPSLEGMEQVAPHLMRCEDEAAFMMVPPPALAPKEPMMLTVVFRPIAECQRAPVVQPLSPLAAPRAGVSR